MEITSTEFEVVHGGEKDAIYPVERGTDQLGRYMFHTLSVKNKIVINNKEFNITYSTGQSYDHDNFSCPANYLELDEEGTDSVLWIISTLQKEALLAKKDYAYMTHEQYVQAILEDLAHAGGAEIKTETDILQLLYYMRDQENHPDFSDYVCEIECELIT